MTALGRACVGVIAVFATLVVSIGSASADTIRVQSTTDTVDAGLVDGLLRPAYAAAQPGDTLDYVAVGTGAALNNARAGLADVVITHAPSLEKQFSDQGFSLEGPGRAIFYSDYVIVGPLADPAGVSANAAHDAVTALEDIAVAGDAAKASFVSRGDNSGTNVQEQLMWGLTSTPPVVKQIASNAGTATDRFEPGTGGKIPTWYVKTNQGQAASLQTAAACNDAPAPAYPNGNCYTMVDRGTFNKLVNAGTITNMKIVSQQNTPEARGGRDLLINPFSAYIVNPDKMAELGLKIPNVEGARRFVDFLVSPGFQNAVDAFPTTTDPAFRQDAFPSVALTQPIPATASAGATIAVTVHLANRQPGAPVVTNMPVQLQQSTDNGQTYTNVGPAALTDAIGDVAFAPVVRSTTRFRISTSVFAATSWNAFSPNTQDVGVVAVAAAPPIKPIDKRKPKVSRFVHTKGRFAFTVSERARIKWGVRKRVVHKVHRGKRSVTVVKLRQVRHGSLRAKKAGRVGFKYKRPLPAGTYRLSVRVTDLAGHTTRKTVGFKVHAKKHARIKG